MAVTILHVAIRNPKLCPVTRALEVIGDSWTILILRDLFLDGPRKFQDLQQSLARASPNTLSARLKKLEQHGIIERRLYAEHPPRAEYALSEAGRELGPVKKARRGGGSRQKRWVIKAPDPKARRAVVAAVQLPAVSDAELAASLAELRQLAKTLGFA